MISGTAPEDPDHTAYRLNKFSAEYTVGEAPCTLSSPQRPPLARRQAMPALARGLLDRPAMLGTAVPDSQHWHRPRGSLAHTPHSSHRANSPADSPRVYFAAMAQLDHRASCMTAESGGPPRASPSRWPWLETALFTAPAGNSPICS